MAKVAGIPFSIWAMLAAPWRANSSASSIVTGVGVVNPERAMREPVTMTVTGIVRSPVDLSLDQAARKRLGSDSWFLALGPAFVERFEGQLATFGVGVEGRSRPGQREQLTEALIDLGGPGSLAKQFERGEFLPLRDARISPLDRGFLYADGGYEVTPVYGGRPFRYAQHHARLRRTLTAIRMQDPLTDAQWRNLYTELIARNGSGDQYVYVQVTRGAEYGRNHAPLPDVPRTVFAFAAPWRGARNV